MLVSLTFLIQLGGWILALTLLFRRSPARRLMKISWWAFPAAGVCACAAFATRSVEIGFPALTNTYESLIFLSAAGNLVTAWLLRSGSGTKGTNPSAGLLSGLHFTLLLLPALAASPLFRSLPRPPIPALQSGWLVLHVSFAFIGEALFLVAFVASLLQLAARDESKAVELDRISYRAIISGFPVYTAGALLFGAIWADQAWGRFWGWDPKETWALITWLVYALYLHVRLVVKVGRRVCAWIAVAGFLFTLFTFFGVNYLLPGLHSYA